MRRPTDELHPVERQLELAQLERDTALLMLAAVSDRDVDTVRDLVTKKAAHLMRQLAAQREARARELSKSTARGMATPSSRVAH